jgi:hypothetical protein
MCAGAARNMVKCCWAGCTVNYSAGGVNLSDFELIQCVLVGVAAAAPRGFSLGYVCVISDDYLAEVSSRQFIFSLTHFLVYV